MNFDQNTLTTVLAVLKILEANYTASYGRSSGYIPGKAARAISNRNWEAERIIKILNDKEKQAFRHVMLSMILMTAGNVATVRNPDLYSREDAKPILSLMNAYTKYLWRIAGGSNPQYLIPTKKDYTTARKLLPIVSSIPSDRKKILQIMKDKNLLGDPKKTAGEEDIKIADVLYRGLHSMSNQSLMYLFFAKNPSWDITRAVSTSEDRQISLNFTNGKEAQAGDGWKMLFTINNDDRRGFDVGNLSFYGDEDEYLLSGVLDIDAIGFKMSAVDVKTGEIEYMDIYRSSNSDLNVKFLGKLYKGKEASNIFLSIMQDNASGVHNEYDDFGVLIGRKISIFRVGKKKYTYDKMATIYVNASVKTN